MPLPCRAKKSARKGEFIEKTDILSIFVFTNLPEPHNDYFRTPRNLGLPNHSVAAITLHPKS